MTRNAAVALVCFAGGVLSTLITLYFLGSVPVALADTEPTNSWIPIVRPLSGTGNLEEGNRQTGGIVQLDGGVIRDSYFENVTFEYGGGAFVMYRSTVAGQVEFRLVGAAANTAQLLEEVGILKPAVASETTPTPLPSGPPTSSPKHPPHIEMNKPNIQRTLLPQALSGDFVSPYGQAPTHSLRVRTASGRVAILVF